MRNCGGAIPVVRKLPGFLGCSTRFGRLRRVPCGGRLVPLRHRAPRMASLRASPRDGRPPPTGRLTENPERLTGTTGRLTENLGRLTGFLGALVFACACGGVSCGRLVGVPRRARHGRDAVPASPSAGNGLAGARSGDVCQSFTFFLAAFDSFCRRSRAVTT